MEKEELTNKTTELSKKVEELDTKQCVSDAIASTQKKLVEKYQSEIEKEHLPAISKLEAENSHLQNCLSDLQDEHNTVLSRKEKAAGENMQLIMESEEFAKKKAELSHEVKDWRAKHKELERENNRLKIQLDMSMSPSKTTTSMEVNCLLFNCCKIKEVQFHFLAIYDIDYVINCRSKNIQNY